MAHSPWRPYWGWSSPQSGAQKSPRGFRDPWTGVTFCCFPKPATRDPATCNSRLKLAALLPAQFPTNGLVKQRMAQVLGQRLSMGDSDGAPGFSRPSLDCWGTWTYGWKNPLSLSLQICLWNRSVDKLREKEGKGWLGKTCHLACEAGISSGKLASCVITLNFKLFITLKNSETRFRAYHISNMCSWCYFALAKTQVL